MDRATEEHLIEGLSAEILQRQHRGYLAIDDAGCVYVLDRQGERVQRLKPDLSFDRLIIDLAEIGL